VWSIVVVVVLPLLEAVVEEIHVVDDLAFQQAIELLGVDSVRAFHFAVEPGRGRLDIGVSDALIEQVLVEGLAELLAVIGLNFLRLERRLGEDVVDELDRGLLIVVRVGA